MGKSWATCVKHGDYSAGPAGQCPKCAGLPSGPSGMLPQPGSGSGCNSVVLVPAALVAAVLALWRRR